MSWLELFDAPPLDIQYASRIIGQLVDAYVRKMEQKARRENGTVEFLVDPRDSSELAYDIGRTLLALDQMRTENLRVLKEHLMEMHMRNPGPIWVSTRPKEPAE